MLFLSRDASSDAFRPPIPIQSGHLFQLNLATLLPEGFFNWPFLGRW